MSRELLKQALNCMQRGPWTQDTKEKYNQTITAIRAHLDNTKDVEPVAFTTGHCKEEAKVGGCQLHNLHCGYPECDRKPANPAPIPPGMRLVAEKDNEAVRGILATPGNYRTYQDQWSALLAAAKGE